jgi:penicillin-binding protein 2
VVWREEKVSQTRLALAQYAILAIFLLLGFGFWRLQIVHGDYYESLAQQNRIKEIPILAPRGKILDREGRIIVDNYPSFSAILLRGQGRINEQKLDAIASGLQIDADELKQREQQMAAQPGYRPILLKYDITADQLAFIEAHRNELPELATITVYRRLYPKDGFMAHVIGYVGQISEDMLTQPRYELYNAGDVVGQSGVEAQYNDLLMGRNGSRRVMVNSAGKELGQLSDTPALPGQTLKLTLDIDLQIAAEEALGDQSGTVAAMDPRTGEILAMVSRPAFDPNLFAARISRKDWSALANDPNKPLLNKAVQAQLAPGSLFKIIMSVAGLEEGVVTPEKKVQCSGGVDYYGRFYKCDEKHGSVNMSRAIAASCNTYFYGLGERLGISRISRYATAFGLGRKTGIDLPQEADGVMPSEEWAARSLHRKWAAGETISVSIGQGAVAVTPVQIMRAIAAIASGGRMVRPYVVSPESLPSGLQRSDSTNESKTIPINPQNWELITDAMADVTSTGTASMTHMAGIDFAGKTGTAQTVSLETRKRMGMASKAFEDNSWFVGFAPRRNPEIVVVVLSQGAGWGWKSAIVASKVIKAYSDKQHHRPMNVARAAIKENNAQSENR